MKMYISGKWIDSQTMLPIVSPYYGDIIDTVPQATPEHVEMALSSAEKGRVTMAHLTAHERVEILNRAADLISLNVEDLAKTISMEEGKPISESRSEAGRIPDLFRLSAFEGSQIRNETLPVEAQSGAKGKLGFTMRVPCGVVVAITPFNYPLLLVVHKIAPALAAGNAVILKPASQTPLTALKLIRLLIEAGLPEYGIQCITGLGSKIGVALCSDSRVRKISFTGSTDVGIKITQVAGIKRLSLELGSNCPVVILADADIEKSADLVAVGGYVNAGQVCISVQRILVERRVYNDFLDALKPRVEAIKVGPSLDENVKLSAMISKKDAERVKKLVDEAKQGGARLITGGHYEGAVFYPTIVTDVKPEMRIFQDELFGPAVTVTPVDGIDEAIALSNDSRFGLGAGIFTRDINKALRFARDVESGNVMINWTSLWRADLIPYGGLKQSGIGKEGPRYAVQEMTEIKTVVFHEIKP